MTPKTIRAGVVQFDTRLGDIEVNLKSALDGIAGLAAQGADLAVLPELWPCGFDNRHLAAHAAQTPRVLGIISAQAAEHSMVIAGSVPEAGPDGICNTLVVMDRDGREAGRYRKIHLFSAGGEERFFAKGKAWAVCDTAAGKLGLMICYDLRFPELCRVLALNGAACVIVPAQWPEARIDHWNALLKARAIENQLFVVGANRCGHDPSLAYGGGSQVVSPTGEVLALARADAPQVILADLDRAVMENFRKRIPCLQERAPESYQTGPKGKS
jgi:predicted amidohydrolase